MLHTKGKGIRRLLIWTMPFSGMFYEKNEVFYISIFCSLLDIYVSSDLQPYDFRRHFTNEYEYAKHDHSIWKFHSHFILVNSV